MAELHTSPVLDEITRGTLHACAEVHRRLGPGLEVRAYTEALGLELSEAGIAYQRNVVLPVFYRGVRLDAAYTLDLCAGGTVVVDVRTLPSVLAVHRAELKARLRVRGLVAGVLVNSHSGRLSDGIVVLKRSVGARQARRSVVVQPI